MFHKDFFLSSSVQKNMICRKLQFKDLGEGEKVQTNGNVVS